MSKKKMRVLLITYMPWREDNNIGNSYSNIFKNMDCDIEFAHIYCRDGLPQNSLCHKYFRLKESDLLQNIIKGKKLGEELHFDETQCNRLEEFSSAYNKLRIVRWEVFFLGRNILWDLADWKTERLDEFVREFNPDLIFGTLTYMPIINKMMLYLHDKFDIPIYIYSWDDVYSLKQHSFSPFFWVRRLLQRSWIEKCVKASYKAYAIDEMMQKEYEEYFKKKFDLLYKGYSFDEIPEEKEVAYPVRFLFMGNLGAGRWTALSKIAKCIQTINMKGNKAYLDIYSLSPISGEMRKKLVIPGASEIHSPVPNEKVLFTMRQADVLIHVEPLNKHDALFYRLSFSTKIVDYFNSGRCILGFGNDTASLEYLRSKDAGLVAYNEKELIEIIECLVNNPEKIKEYGMKAWKCGMDNHQISSIQEKIYKDFQLAISKY